MGSEAQWNSYAKLYIIVRVLSLRLIIFQCTDSRPVHIRAEIGDKNITLSYRGNYSDLVSPKDFDPAGRKSALLFIPVLFYFPEFILRENAAMF